MPETQTNSPPLWQVPPLSDALASRIAGVVPRFELTHTCRECGRECYCPDRYIADSCTAMEHTLSKGWVWSYTCTPCLYKSSALEREKWYEAHGG